MLITEFVLKPVGMRARFPLITVFQHDTEFSSQYVVLVKFDGHGKWHGFVTKSSQFA